MLLVEEANCLGGVSTVGGVSGWFAHTEGMGDIFEAVKAELAHYGLAGDRYYNPEHLKIIWQQLVTGVGAKVLLHGRVIGAHAAGGIVQAVTVHLRGVTREIRPRVCIDATGEGDLSAQAGAGFDQGDSAGRTLHMSLTFCLCDTGKPVTPYLPPGLREIHDEEELPGLRAWLPLADGRVYCNMTKVMGHDPTDGLSLSEAEIEARRQLARVLHFLQRTRFPHHQIVSSGAKIGIREGRRIRGDYVLTERDILESRRFDDTVAVATAQIDFHSLTEPGHAGRRERVPPYGIPYRCLTVAALGNLLTAGKCISGDQVAMSSYRMTPTCCAMGQAAGTAAALAVEQNLSDLRQVNVGKLQSILTREGIELDPSRHQSFAP